MIGNQIVNKIIDYICVNLEKDISVDDIAVFSGYSKFYISRLFRQETGESIYGFIKRAKIEQSAFRLKIEKNKSITEIGECYGYSSCNFSTLFREYFRQSPNKFRKRITEETAKQLYYTGFNDKPETYLECCKKITIENLPDYFVLYERQKSNYNNMPSLWANFIECYKEFITPKTVFINRTKDDPEITDPDNCIYELCMTVDKNDSRITAQKTAAAGTSSRCSAPTGINTMAIQGGKFAVYHYKGYLQKIYAAYQSLFSNWLIESGNELDSRYSFDIYRFFDRKTMYIELDICIPIK